MLTGHTYGCITWLGVCTSGTFLTVKIGAVQVGLNFEQETREANFRYSLVRASNCTRLQPGGVLLLESPRVCFPNAVSAQQPVWSQVWQI